MAGSGASRNAVYDAEKMWTRSARAIWRTSSGLTGAIHASISASSRHADSSRSACTAWLDAIPMDGATKATLIRSRIYIRTCSKAHAELVRVPDRGTEGPSATDPRVDGANAPRLSCFAAEYR